MPGGVGDTQHRQATAGVLQSPAVGSGRRDCQQWLRFLQEAGVATGLGGFEEGECFEAVCAQWEGIILHLASCLMTLSQPLRPS